MNTLINKMLPMFHNNNYSIPEFIQTPRMPVKIRIQIKTMIQYLGICSLILMLLIVPETLRSWLDVLHKHIGPTALFISALALISMQEYQSRIPGVLYKAMIKRSNRSANLCPAIGTIGTLIALAQGDNLTPELIANAINSTLYGLGYSVLHSFMIRTEVTDFNNINELPLLNPESHANSTQFCDSDSVPQLPPLNPESHANSTQFCDSDSVPQLPPLNPATHNDASPTQPCDTAQHTLTNPATHNDTSQQGESNKPDSQIQEQKDYKSDLRKPTGDLAIDKHEATIQSDYAWGLTLNSHSWSTKI